MRLLISLIFLGLLAWSAISKRRRNEQLIREGKVTREELVRKYTKVQIISFIVVIIVGIILYFLVSLLIIGIGKSFQI